MAEEQHSSGLTRGELEAESDAKFTLLPVLPGERIWGPWDFTIVMAAFAIATWTFLTGGYLASIVSATAGILAVGAGLLVGFLLVVPAGALGSAKYGVDQYIQLRAMFGTKGAATLGLATCVFGAWFNMAAIYPMLGKSVANIVSVWAPLGDTAYYWLAAAIGIAALIFTWWITREGPSFVKKFDWFIVPGLAFVMVLLFVFIFKDYGWSAISSATPTDTYDDKQTMYVLAFDTGIGFGLSWFWLMGAMTRITTTQRAAVGGYYWGSFIPSFAGIIMGFMTALVVGETDPTKWMIPLAGPALGIIALLFIILANISSGALMAYTGVIALRQLKVGRKWSWSLATFLVILPAILTMLVQDLVYSRMGMVMAVWAVLFGPMCAVVFVDHIILRKQHFNLRSLYDTSSSSDYYFWKGWNPAFFITLAAGCTTYLIIMNPLTLNSHLFFKYTTASLPTFFVSCLVYYCVTKLWIIPKGMGGYPRLPKEGSLRKQEILRLKETI